MFTSRWSRVPLQDRTPSACRGTFGLWTFWTTSRWTGSQIPPWFPFLKKEKKQINDCSKQRYVGVNVETLTSDKVWIYLMLEQENVLCKKYKQTPAHHVWHYYLGRGSNNQNGNLRWHLPWRGGGSRGGLECHIPILKKDFFKNHLESFPDC